MKRCNQKVLGSAVVVVFEIRIVVPSSSSQGKVDTAVVIVPLRMMSAVETLVLLGSPNKRIHLHLFSADSRNC